MFIIPIIVFLFYMSIFNNNKAQQNLYTECDGDSQNISAILNYLAKCLITAKTIHLRSLYVCRILRNFLAHLVFARLQLLSWRTFSNI